MTGMTWFQARALGTRQKRPIRRAGWTKWIFFRFSLWLMQDGDAAVHVVRNDEFGADEFLAKDWTDVTWDGGSYPPCTTPGGASEFAPSDTGGLGAWTTTANCAGAGDAGGVLASTGTAETPPTGLALYLYALPSVLEGGGAYAPPLTESSPIEIRPSDGEAGLDGWQFTGTLFVHYTVTGAPAAGTEIVGLWTLEGISGPLNEADLKGVADYDPDTFDSANARPFFGHTIASHGRTNWYYLGTAAAVAGEPYPFGGLGFTAVPERTVIRVMLGQRHTDGSISNVVQSAYTLPAYSGEVRYWNEEQSFTASCGGGSHGTSVTRTVEAHSYSSTISLAAANATALAAATAAANAELVCDPDFPNEEQSFTAECGAGTHGDPVTVTKAAGTYLSPTSVEDANALALAAATAEANAGLVCVPDE